MENKKNEEAKIQSDVSTVQGSVINQTVDKDSWPIDKWTWFKLSRTWVTGAEERIQKQVDRLQTSISWFFGLGSSAAIVSFFLKEPNFTFQVGVFFSAVLLLLLLAYCFSTLAITTVTKSVAEPNDDDEIRKVFNKSNRWSQIFILISSACLIFGLTLFPFALLSSIKRNESITDNSNVYQAQYKARSIIKTGNGEDSTNKYITAIDLSGFTPDSTQLKFKISTGTNFFNAITIDSFRHTISHGKFDLVYQLERKLKLSKDQYYISLVYNLKSDSITTKTILLLPL